MFLPIGDSPNPKNFTPWVTWSLIAANVAIYLLISLPLEYSPLNISDPMVEQYLRYLRQYYPNLLYDYHAMMKLSAYDAFVFLHGFKPAAPDMIDLFESMFLHAGILHLAGNMLFLWIFGDNVEHRLGRFWFFTVYLASGVFATLSFALLAGNSMTPLVGASGAISGVLGIYFYLFPKNQIKVFVFIFFFFDVWLLPSRIVLGFFLVLDNLLPMLFGAQSGVAHGAHVGGFFAGLLVAWMGERAGWMWPWSKAGRYRLGAEKKNPSGNKLLVEQALSKGDATRAIEALSKLDKQQLSSLDPKSCATLSSWLAQAGHERAASSLLRTCIANNPNSSDLDKAFLALGLLRFSQGQPTAAYQHLLNVFDYNPDAETARLAKMALDKIDYYRKTRP